MNTKSSKSKTNKSPIVIWVATILVALIAILLIVIAVRAPSKSNDPSPTEATVRMTGELVCLPHKNMDGPHTLECATGFKSEDNKYYGIKDDNQKVGSTPYNKPVVVDGKLIKESSDVYQMEGSIIVESIVPKEASTL
ncbi:MAG TPA: hypothetical protein VF733_05585 [Candidatus Saccharimonadales bacterium]